MEIRRGTILMCLLLTAALTSHAEEKNYLARIKALHLPSLSGKVPTYYSPGHREHAAKLQAAVEDMNSFFRQRLGVETKITLALLDSSGWTAVTGEPYGIPRIVDGTPPVIFMPATSGSPAFALLMARREAIPAAELDAFLREKHTTFEAMADQQVDLIGLHELGHAFTTKFHVDPPTKWFGEFLATYWSYAYISERHPDWRIIFDLLARPSKVRPKNTSLEDFERLYSGVDDYGWYQGMFALRVREVYSEHGLQFLRDIQATFPETKDPRPSTTTSMSMKPEQLLDRLEMIAPGFKKWAVGFGSAPQEAKFR